MREETLDLAIATLMADVVKEHRDRLREEIAEEFKKIGADSSKVKIGDTTIGKISLIEQKPKIYVANEQAFLQWVIKNHPQEVLQQVRESFQKFVLDMVTYTEDGKTFLFPDSGEVVEGLGVRNGSSYVSTRFEKNGREILTDALRSGKVKYEMLSESTRQIGEAENE